MQAKLQPSLAQRILRPTATRCATTWNEINSNIMLRHRGIHGGSLSKDNIHPLLRFHQGEWLHGESSSKGVPELTFDGKNNDNRGAMKRAGKHLSHEQAHPTRARCLYSVSKGFLGHWQTAVASATHLICMYSQYLLLTAYGHGMRCSRALAWSTTTCCMKIYPQLTFALTILWSGCL